MQTRIRSRRSHQWFQPTVSMAKNVAMRAQGSAKMLWAEFDEVEKGRDLAGGR